MITQCKYDGAQMENEEHYNVALWEEERRKRFFTIYWDNEQIIHDY